jgi:prevent-host-death family protein
MQISVKEAQVNLDDLLQRVEEGEDIIITREGETVARLVPVKRELSREERRAALDRIREMAPHRKPGAPTADRSHDDLYDENGLPA